MAYKYCLVLLVCFFLVNPTEAWSLRRKLKKLGKKIVKGVKNAGKGIKKAGCKALFGVVCPAAVGVASASLATGTSGTGALIVAAGAAAGKQACHVRRKKCKRDAGMKMMAFSDNFADYDSNEDKVISYEEFVYSVMRSVDLADASELEQPFFFADNNGDVHLDIDEFQAAPFLFAHMLANQRDLQQTKTTTAVTTTSGETTTIQETSTPVTV